MLGGVPLPLRLRRLIAVVLCLLAFPAAAQAAPKVSIFYYPWYGNPKRDGAYQHWNQTASPADRPGHELLPGSRRLLERDPRVVEAQMREIAGAGIREVVSSWWGWGSPEDEWLPMIAVGNEQGSRWPSRSSPTRPHGASFAADLVHLKRTRDHALLRLPPLRDRRGELGDRAPPSRGCRCSRRPPTVTRAGCSLRGDVHVRRRPSARRARVALRAGAQGRAPVRTLGRARLRRAACDRRHSIPAARCGRNLRRDVAGRDPAQARTGSRSRATTSGTRARRSSRP